MSFANDQLYDGYLRTNMPTIVTKVKVREIVVHLPCLTDHDRETIEAKREMCGNFNGMVLLLDCLKRRESWPEHFIRALEKCQHGAIAAEVRAEYDRLRGAADSTPSSTPPTAVKAHVHLAPSATHPGPGPQTAGPGQAAAFPPSPPPAKPEPQVQTPAPAPLPVSEPPPASSTPPQVQDRPEPEESSELEEVSFSLDPSPEPAQDAEPCATALCDVMENSAESPAHSDAADAPSTPEKSPVQETAPIERKLTPDVTPPPEDSSEAPDTQMVAENCTAEGSTPASPVGPAVPDGAPVCLSTPHTLRTLEPYSGDSDRLEISALDEDREDEVRVNVVHVSQQPSPLNLDGQRVLNGAAAKEVSPVPESASKTLSPEPEKPSPRSKLGANAKFLVTAVGVGACALLVAWKMKH